MAWSDAARAAAAEVRRRHGEAGGKFHEYGTPARDDFYMRPENRKKIARDLKQVRAEARKGIRPSGHSAQSAINAAAYASRMRDQYGRTQVGRGDWLGPGSGKIMADHLRKRK